MISTRALRERALAISTICRSETGRSRMRASGRMALPSSSSSACVPARMARWSRNSPPFSRPSQMFSVTVRSGARLNSWWITTTPAASACAPLV